MVSSESGQDCMSFGSSESASLVWFEDGDYTDPPMLGRDSDENTPEDTPGPCFTGARSLVYSNRPCVVVRDASPNRVQEVGA